MSKLFYVSKQGNDNNSGEISNPFKTISYAASIAKAGDSVVVHEGTYREWVNPINGGDCDKNRITYKVAEGEEVIISGAEIIKGWQKVKDSIYKKEIVNSFFGEYNPYKEEIIADWFFDLGRIHHTGEVYINGRAMIEMETLDQVLYPTENDKIQDVKWSKHTWYCESDERITTIWANFHDYNPNENMIEINVRPFCFWPEETGRDYITVSGFIMKQAATKWAPPTALQEGLIGPHWSKGWIIENNTISDSKCSGISLGKDRASGHNKWKRFNKKHGAQTERESIFLALKNGWSKETIGSHVVRNNTIFNCGQTGICGHLGAVFSEIYDNHIYDIYTNHNYYGFEIAGIKLHAAIDTVIKNNHIHNTYGGIWLDWQAQGARVSQNLIYENEFYDVFVEVSHGPYTIDNNILLSNMNFIDASQGGAIINNLMTGYLTKRETLDRYTPYHFAHSTQIAGIMTFIGGDNRYYNNIFTAQHEGYEISGLARYNEWSIVEKYNMDGLRTPLDYAKNKLPMYLRDNVYYNTALPHIDEKNHHMFTNHNPNVYLEKDQEAIYINFDFGEKFADIKAKTVSASDLGSSYESECAFENPDGTDMNIDNDFFGNKREDRTIPGPFLKIKQGKQRIKILDRKA